MRVFLAVHPGPQLVQDLTTQLDPWRSTLKVRWTRPDSWHVTLQFLGEWSESRLDDLQVALAELEAGPPFDLCPGELGAFPNLGSPRVLFLQMAGDGQVDRLARLVRGGVERVWPDGPQDRKPFRGHLTLARVKDRLRSAEGDFLAHMKLGPFAPVHVKTFHLIASTLLPGGSRYRNLATFAMRKKGE